MAFFLESLAIHYHWRFNPQAVSLFSYDFLSPTACYLERLREFPNKRPLQTTDKPFIDNSLSPHNVCLVTRWLNYSSNSQVSPAVTNDFLFRVLHPKPRFSFDLSFQAAYDWQIMVSWQQQTAENERKIAAAQEPFNAWWIGFSWQELWWAPIKRETGLSHHKSFAIQFLFLWNLCAAHIQILHQRPKEFIWCVKRFQDNIHRPIAWHCSWLSFRPVKISGPGIKSGFLCH